MNIKLTFFLICVLCLACASPQKSFKKGDYDAAYSKALKNLKKGSKKREDKTILNKSFAELVASSQAEYDKYLASDIIEDWEIAYETHTKLLEKYYDGKRFLYEDFDTKLALIESNHDSLGITIADNYLSLAQMSMEDFKIDGNKLLAQDAFLFYEKAESYNSKYKPSIQRDKQFAFDAGIINILVEMNGPFDYRYEIDRVFDNVENYSKGFNRISYNRNLLNADCILEIDFSRLDEDIRQSRDTRTYTDRIEDGYTTEVDTAGKETKIPIYKEIEAEVRTIREEVTYEFQVRVSDRFRSPYCNFRNRTYTEDETVVNEYYEVNGDTDAIPSNIDWRNRNQNVADEDKIAEALIEKLYDAIERDYFR